MPDVLVDDELSCPMAPCWLPGGKVLRHLSCCGGSALGLDGITPEAAPLHMLHWSRLPILPARR
jgi:hypothetical protein